MDNTYCSEERYIGESKLTMLILKVLSCLGSKKAKQRLHYIYLDYYYWWKWQKMKRDYPKLGDKKIFIPHRW